MSTQERALVGGYNTFGNQGEANADVKKKYPIKYVASQSKCSTKKVY